jgi:hypothetical protein
MNAFKMKASAALLAVVAGLVFSPGFGLAEPAGSVPASAPSTADKAPVRQCFLARNVNSFKEAGREAVNIRVGVRDIYRLDLFSTCDELRWTETIGLESRGSSWICSGLDAVLIVPTATGPRRCPVTAVHKLSDDEINALDRKVRP